jgi:hypothetical protein
MKQLDHLNIVKLVEVIDDPESDHFHMGVTTARASICVEVLECQRAEYYGPDDNDKLLHDIVD